MRALIWLKRKANMNFPPPPFFLALPCSYDCARVQLQSRFFCKSFHLHYEFLVWIYIRNVISRLDDELEEEELLGEEPALILYRFLLPWYWKNFCLACVSGEVIEMKKKKKKPIHLCSFAKLSRKIFYFFLRYQKIDLYVHQLDRW